MEKETIHYLCYTGDTEKVKKYLENVDENISSVDQFGYAPIHYAIAFGHMDIFDLLSSYVHLKTSFELSCIHVAILFDKMEFVEKLLSQKDAVDNRGVTPLMYASIHFRNDMVSLLINNGANVHAFNIEGETALHTALGVGNSKAAALLIRAGANLNASKKDSKPPFSKIKIIPEMNSKSLLKTIESEYKPIVPYSTEKMYQSTDADAVIKSSTGKEFRVHKCILSKYKEPNPLSNDAMTIYKEWLYLQKSTILEDSLLGDVINVVTELLHEEAMSSYLATYISKQKENYSAKVLKTFSDEEIINKNMTLSKYVVARTFERYDSNRNIIKELSKEEVGNLVELLPLKEEKAPFPLPLPPDQFVFDFGESKNDETQYPMNTVNKGYCLAILNKLNAEKVLAFLNKVEEERDGAIGYYKIVKKPMWINEIRSRITSDKYSTPHDFMVDLRQVWQNGMLYNIIGSKYYIYAYDLKKESEQLWRDTTFSMQDDIALVNEVQNEKLKIMFDDDDDDDIKEKRNTDGMKVFTLEDKEKLKEKIEKLKDEDKQQIPTLLNSGNNENVFKLDLISLTDEQLQKLEEFCDSKL